VGLGDYVPGDSGETNHLHLYKIISTAYLIFGVLIMVWNLEIFSQIPEFNIYKWFSLSKDGILTNHKTIVHSAAATSDTYDYPSSVYDSKLNTIPYQQQVNQNLPLKNEEVVELF